MAAPGDVVCMVCRSSNKSDSLSDGKILGYLAKTYECIWEYLYVQLWNVVEIGTAIEIGCPGVPSR